MLYFELKIKNKKYTPIIVFLFEKTYGQYV